MTDPAITHLEIIALTNKVRELETLIGALEIRLKLSEDERVMMTHDRDEWKAQALALRGKGSE